MAILLFHGEYSKLKEKQFKFYRNNRIIYMFEPSEYAPTLIIKKADKIIYLSNKDARFASQALEFAILNREYIETLPDFNENNNLSLINVVQKSDFSYSLYDKPNVDAIENREEKLKAYSEIFASEHFIVSHLKVLLWLNDNFKLEKAKCLYEDNGHSLYL